MPCPPDPCVNRGAPAAAAAPGSLERVNLRRSARDPPRRGRTAQRTGHTVHPTAVVPAASAARRNDMRRMTSALASLTERGRTTLRREWHSAVLTVGVAALVP